QWRGEMLDRRTDVYGLAIMAYLLLTKHVPFEAETAHAMMYMHLDNPPPPMRQTVPTLPEAVDAVVLRALAKHPDARYASAGAFAWDFKQAVEGLPIHAADYPTPPSQSAARPAIEYPPPAYSAPPARYDHLRARPRGATPRLLIFAFGLTLWLVIGITVGVGLLVLEALAADDTPNTLQEATPSATAPPVTPNAQAVDVPRIRIDDPRDAPEIPLGETVRIEVTAFDSQGVTHVELRRFDQTLDRVAAEDAQGVSPLPAVLRYTPTSTGRHRLELIAYRGDVAGDPRYILVEVR
ncbi:MAG: serine/threonine protein kinase, partial [Anaerolineales bacterium]